MTIEWYATLFGFAVLTCGTPGPNNLMLLTAGANFGFRRSLPHILGITAGCQVLLLAIALGLGQLFSTWPVSIVVLKLAGSAFLIYMAAQLLRPRRKFLGDEPGAAPARHVVVFGPAGAAGVLAGEHHDTGGRADRRGPRGFEAHPGRGQPVDVGGGMRGSVAPEPVGAEIVGKDQDDVGARLGRSGECTQREQETGEEERAEEAHGENGVSVTGLSEKVRRSEVDRRRESDLPRIIGRGAAADEEDVVEVVDIDAE